MWKTTFKNCKINIHKNNVKQTFQKGISSFTSQYLQTELKSFCQIRFIFLFPLSAFLIQQLLVFKAYKSTDPEIFFCNP